MSKVRVIYNPDKTVSIIHPAPKSKKENETEEQWLNRVLAKATPEGAIYEDIDSSELPQSREDRNAWEGEKGKGVKINQIKAKKLHDEKELKAKIEIEKQAILEEMAIERLKNKKEI